MHSSGKAYGITHACCYISLNYSAGVLLKRTWIFFVCKATSPQEVFQLETQLSQLLNDRLDLQGQCDALTARAKTLEDSLTKSTVLSILKTASSYNKCKKRRHDVLLKCTDSSAGNCVFFSSLQNKSLLGQPPHSETLPRCLPFPLPSNSSAPISPSNSPNPLQSVDHPDQPRTPVHPERTASV